MMAQGRMLNKKISMDKRVNEISDDTGRLLFTWIIPHLDVEGRFTAEPQLVKSIVLPWRDDVTIEQVEKYLQEYHDLGLFCIYSVNGSHYLCAPAFEKNQIGLRKEKERPSDIPPPPDDKAEIRTEDADEPPPGFEDPYPWVEQVRPDSVPSTEQVQTKDGVGTPEEKRTEQKLNGTEEKGAAVAARAPPKTRKSRKKTPKSAAVEYYRACTNRYPNRVQIRAIDDAVDDLTQLSTWKKAVDLWLRKGWNPQNVDGMLEVFENDGRSKYDRGQDSAANEPKPIPGYELADLDEVRRCQEEQWAREKAATERAALPDVQGGGGGNARPPPERA